MGDHPRRFRIHQPYLASRSVGDVGGRTIGEADRSYSPIENPVGPLDLQATLFDHFSIDKAIQRTDMSGRPRYLLEGEAKVIL